MFDFSKLKGLIRERGFTQHDIAEHLHISDNALSFKLNGKTYFTAKEMNDICDLLAIDNNDIALYFFAIRV